MTDKEGFTCECGKFHEFGAYVMAHTHEELIHTCDNCGRQHGTKQLRVWLIKGKKGTKP